jgi:hypothetical protein
MKVRNDKSENSELPAEFDNPFNEQTEYGSENSDPKASRPWREVAAKPRPPAGHRNSGAPVACVLHGDLARCCGDHLRPASLAGRRVDQRQPQYWRANLFIQRPKTADEAWCAWLAKHTTLAGTATTVGLTPARERPTSSRPRARRGVGPTKGMRLAASRQRAPFGCGSRPILPSPMLPSI